MSDTNDSPMGHATSNPSVNTLVHAGGPSASRLGSDGLTYPVGFFHFAFNESKGAGVGGLLVTDNTGIPLEFVITTAVKTTPAQRLLYGKRLRSFIAINLCAKQLLQNVKTSPRIVFVEHPWLLVLHEHTTIPVLQLIPSAHLDGPEGRPTVIPPDDHPEYAEILDLTSLDSDMVDVFERIEACRNVLSSKSADYTI